MGKKEKETRSPGSLTMRDLTEDEQPYEKCLRYGAGALTDRELLAALLRTGIPGMTSLDLASELLHCCRYREGLSGLLHMSAGELMDLPGIGKVKAVQILCIGELARRLATEKARKMLDFHDPATVAEYYMERLRHEEQEIVICMMLDTRDHLIGETELTRGTVDHSLISSRELFLEALSYHAVHLILIHNHPSGDPTPSRDDLLVTKKVAEAGALIGIDLLDHIIIGDRRFVSLAGDDYTPRELCGACAEESGKGE